MEIDRWHENLAVNSAQGNVVVRHEALTIWDGYQHILENHSSPSKCRSLALQPRDTLRPKAITNLQRGFCTSKSSALT